MSQQDDNTNPRQPERAESRDNMSTSKLPLIELDRIVLLKGNHGRRKDGVCALEAAAWLAGLRHSDTPACVCPVIRSFVISWNDAIPDDARRTELLKPFLLQILDTRSTPAVEIQRSYLAFDWLVRVQTPAWLDLSPNLAIHAAALRALTQITDRDTIDASTPIIAATGDAARAVAMAAARDSAWAAARAAAGAKLQPTLDALQASAADLLTRMIAVTDDQSIAVSGGPTA